MKNTILIVLGLMVVVLALLYSDKREYEAMQSARQYEECVIREFDGRTVLEVYYATGEYPVCEW